MTWATMTDEEIQHVDHLALELERELVDAVKEWCRVHEVGPYTPAVSCGALLMVAGIVTSNAHRHYGGPGLKHTLETFEALWRLE